MVPNITDRLRTKFEYVNPFQVRVRFCTLGELERSRFERKCKGTCINPDNFDLYIEERQSGVSRGKTDRYFEIKSDRCLRDVLFRDQRYHYTHSHKKLRSFPDVLKLYRSTEQLVDECMDDLLWEFEEPVVAKTPKTPKTPKVVEFSRFGELEEEIECEASKCCHPRWTFSIRDKGGHQRSLCCHPYNKDKKAYGVHGVTQRSECMCSLHRDDTFWRRLSSYALTDRATKIRGDHRYVKTVVGLPSVYEYQRNLEDGFKEQFKGVVDSSYIEKSYVELEREGFVIDEVYPRCEGRPLRNPVEIAHFLAKVFHHNNTQLLIQDNKHARKLGIDTNQHKMLINGSKGGIVERVARENFDKIVPSSEAISYMLDLVNTFIEKEPKLEF